MDIYSDSLLKEMVETRRGFMDKPTAELEADVMIPGNMSDNKKEGSGSLTKFNRSPFSYNVCVGDFTLVQMKDCSWCPLVSCLSLNLIGCCKTFIHIVKGIPNDAG